MLVEEGVVEAAKEWGEIDAKSGDGSGEWADACGEGNGGSC